MFIPSERRRHRGRNRRPPGSCPVSGAIVIVGGAIAGQAVCEALRERDPGVAITLVCGEPAAPYDRVRLSQILLS
jgi:hypothetical protein